MDVHRARLASLGTPPRQRLRGLYSSSGGPGMAVNSDYLMRVVIHDHGSLQREMAIGGKGTFQGSPGL